MFRKFSKSLFFKKKAQEEMGPSAIVGLVLAFIAVAVLTYIIFVFIGLFSKSTQELDSTLNNYNELTLKVDEMIKDKEDQIEYDRFPLYISDGYSIVGFDRFQDYVFDQVNNKIYKPSKCRNKACICLYHMPAFYNEKELDDITTRDIGVVDCVSYRQHVIFVSKFREHRFGHKDTAGLKRDGLFMPTTGSELEYLVMHGFMSTKFIGFNFFKTDWDINNIELRKVNQGDQIYFEVSAIPDEDTLKQEKIKAYAFELLGGFLTTPLPAITDSLTQHPTEGIMAGEILSENPELYQGRTYQSFLSALFVSDLYFDEKKSVFMSVSYSLFHDVIPKDEEGNPFASMIYIDYPPFTTAGITDDFEVDLSGEAQSPYDPSDLLVTKEFLITETITPSTIARIHFFVSGMP